MLFNPALRNRVMFAAGRARGPTVTIRTNEGFFRFNALVAEVATRGDWRKHVEGPRASSRFELARGNRDMANRLAEAADQLEENGRIVDASRAPAESGVV